MIGGKNNEKELYLFTFHPFTLSKFQLFNLDNTRVFGQTLSSSGQISSSSSSSGGTPSTLSDKFSGIWSAKIQRTVSVNGVVVKEGTHPINLRLCSKNGQIKGIVVHPGFFTRALIVSQNVISENEVEVGVKDRRGRTATLRLTLVGDLQLNGAFSNGVNFESTKKSDFRLCEAFRRCDINDLFNTKEFDNQH